MNATNTMMPVEIYTDGSSRKNPGESGLAYVINYYEQPAGDSNAMPVLKTIEGSKGFRLSTNNRMEIMAALEGLSTVIDKVNDGTFQGLNQINLYSDSEYFVKAVNQNWITKWQQNNWMTSGFGGKKPKDVKNKDLWERVIQTQNQLRSMSINLTITHVLGHNGNENNEKADRLAVAAAENYPSHLIDEGYEKTAPVLNR